MVGNNSKTTVVLQPRDRAVLVLLATLRIATWQQIAALCAFRSRTRVSSRLSLLSSAGHIRREYIGTIAGGRRVIYMLQATRLSARRGPAGREAAISHQLAINDCRVSLHQAAIPTHTTYDWAHHMFRHGSLIPDATITFGGTRKFFLEVDRGSEGSAVWRSKITRYLALAHDQDALDTLNARSFGVLVVASSEGAVQKLRRLALEQTEKIFWFTTHQSLTSEGFLSPIWLRPTGEEKLTLTYKEGNEIL